MFEWKGLNIPAQDYAIPYHNHDNIAENIWDVNSHGYVIMYCRYGTASDGSIHLKKWGIRTNLPITQGGMYLFYNWTRSKTNL